MEDQPAARGGGVQRLVQGPEPGAAAAQRATMVIRSCRDRTAGPGSGRRGCRRRGGSSRHAASSGRPTVLPGCLSAKIRMQPASIRARACRSRFCPDVDTRAYLISALARFAGPGASGSSPPAAARPAGSASPATRRKTAVPQLSDTPASQHLFQALATSRELRSVPVFRSRVHGCPKPSAAPGSC